MNNLKPGTVTKIRYSKEGDTTERVIIPTTVPANIKAIDVSGLPETLQQNIADSYLEYQQYLKQHIKTAFSFEDWMQHSKEVEISPKWRTFKPENTEII